MVQRLSDCRLPFTMRLLLRQLPIGLTAVALGTCGGRPSPLHPDPSGANTLRGVVLETGHRMPAAGVSVGLTTGQLYNSVAWSSTVQTDAAGQFSFEAVPSGVLLVGLSGSGYITRTGALEVSGSRSDLVLDVIADAPPFSLDLYRQFARDALESTTGLAPIKPLQLSPKFYLRTVTEDTLESIPQTILDGVRRVVVNSVPELTGGRFTVETFETGADSRDPESGWIQVLFVRDASRLTERSGTAVVGDSTIGASKGRIRLLYAPSLDAQGLYNIQHCESLTVEAADHEVVHAMGFYHTADTLHDFHSGQGCPGNGRPRAIVYHAAIMYRRPLGNLDVDRDVTVSFGLLTTGLPSLRNLVSSTESPLLRAPTLRVRTSR